MEVENLKEGRGEGESGGECEGKGTYRMQQELAGKPVIGCPL